MNINKYRYEGTVHMFGVDPTTGTAIFDEGVLEGLVGTNVNLECGTRLFLSRQGEHLIASFNSDQADLEGFYLDLDVEVEAYYDEQENFHVAAITDIRELGYSSTHVDSLALPLKKTRG